MDEIVASISTDEMRQRIKRRSRLKGRQPEEASLAEVHALLGDAPPEGWPRDRLIELLHVLNDACRGLHDKHLVALSKIINVPMAEIYEVATFYHHFEVLRDGEIVSDAAPGSTDDVIELMKQLD